MRVQIIRIIFMAIIIFRSPAFGYVISETSSGLPLHIDIDNQLIIDYERHIRK